MLTAMSAETATQLGLGDQGVDNAMGFVSWDM